MNFYKNVIEHKKIINYVLNLKTIKKIDFLHLFFYALTQEHSQYKTLQASF